MSVGKEGLNRLVLVGKDLEQIQHADQLQSLNHELGWGHQLYGAAALLGRGHSLDQNSNAAGVDHGHFREVDRNARVAGGQRVFYSLAEGVHPDAQADGAAKLNNLNFRKPADADFHRAPLGLSEAVAYPW